MSGIFISYRRDDTAGHAGRIYDRLAATFGAEQVFMDVDTIQPGEDFTRVLADRIGSCSVLVTIIGKQWLAAQDRNGKRRLDDPGDYVRLEIAAALERGIVIVPVLVEGAALPRPEELPPALSKLADHQALSVTDDRFHAEVDELIHVLQRQVEGSGGAGWHRALRGRRAWFLAAGMGVALIALGWWSFDRHAREAERQRIAMLLSGRWHADVPSEHGSAFRIVFDLQASGDTLLGTVDYPTGTGAIRDGRVRDAHVSFATAHTPQFETQEAITRFEGYVTGRHLDLVMSSSQAVYKFTARKD